MKYSSKFSFCVLFGASLLASGCSTYDNFTTFFNTYYNAKRLINETETEFEYQDEKKRVSPKVFVTQPNYWIKPDQRKNPLPFMGEFVIDARKLQPVKIKLDSVIIKGSKIIAKHPKSAYVENTLLLMAQSYFYMNDWINCQVKCSELIDRYPQGDLSPDAHLMIAKTYLIRKKNTVGLTILSRTVDVAWLKKRYDILSEAFRLEAELALFDNRFDDALRPYKQAIAQSEDSEQSAKWQIDLAALLYRIGKFEQAAKAFQAVKNFSPDYQAKFESDFYYALCQIRLKHNEEGMSILDNLYNDGKYEEWREYILAGRMLNYTLTKQDSLYKSSEKIADSLYSSSYMIQAFYFEKGMMLFEEKDYSESRRYLAQVRNAKSDYYTTANKLYNNLMAWNLKRESATSGYSKFTKGELSSDSSKLNISNSCFEFGRTHELLGNPDSATFYYRIAAEIAPKDSMDRAQYVYSYQRMIRNTNPMLADSLFEVLADYYPKTDYGREAFVKLGYTEHYTIDSIADIFASGNQLRKNGIYNLAIDKYNAVYNNYPDNKLAPKSLYSIGWIYENKLKVQDSALFYYSLLISKYPKSEYAKDISLLVNYTSAMKTGAALPDSLQKKQVFLSPKRNYLAEIEADNKAEIKRTTSFDKQKSIKDDNSLNPKDMLNNVKESFNTKNILGDTPGKLTDPNTFIPGIKIGNPLDAFKAKDSTSTKQSVAPIKPIPEEKKK